MADISGIVTKTSNKVEMTTWLINHNKDNNLMDYWDAGDSFLRNINKSPLPINFAISIKQKHPLR